MKKLILALCILSAGVLHSFAQQRVFIRVYSITNMQFTQGYFAGTTDSSLFIIKHNIQYEIPVSKIGKIKTNRSTGHAILLTSGTLLVAGGIIGLSSHSGFFAESASERFIAGALLGTAAGIPVGAIIGNAKKRQKFSVKGKKENWLLVRPGIDRLPLYKTVLHTK